MTQEILIALVGVIGVVVSALIGAFATIYSANIRAKEAGELGKSSVNWVWIGLITTFIGMIGLVCGLLFAALWDLMGFGLKWNT